jgi:N-acetylglucosamine-6-phosphate deacetylase
MSFASWDLAAAVSLATRNPARVIGSMATKGTLAPAADADIVVLSPSGEVLQTICRGAA